MLKIKTIATLALLSFNAYAYHGHGFKIVSEKTTHTPGFTATIFSMDSLTPNTVHKVEAKANNSDGQTKQYIKVSGTHKVILQNTTTSTKRYSITYTLSCASALNNFERNIDLEPNGAFIDGSYDYGTVQKSNIGRYDIIVQTSVDGYESASKEDHGNLNIHK